MDKDNTEYWLKIGAKYKDTLSIYNLAMFYLVNDNLDQSAYWAKQLLKTDWKDDANDILNQIDEKLHPK